MPWGDRTGPLGMGPMTGRGAGRCAGYAGPGYLNPGQGWGRGRGRRGGFGRRPRAGGFAGWHPAPWGWPWGGAPGPYPTPYDVPYAQADSRSRELDALKNQARYFEEALDDIKERIGELEKTETEE